MRMIGGGGDGGGAGLGFEEGGEIIDSERREMGTVEGIGIEMEDGFSGRRSSGGDYRFRETGANDD